MLGTYVDTYRYCVKLSTLETKLSYSQTAGQNHNNETVAKRKCHEIKIGYKVATIRNYYIKYILRTD
jgi:hypothetical protein